MTAPHVPHPIHRGPHPSMAPGFVPPPPPPNVNREATCAAADRADARADVPTGDAAFAIRFLGTGTSTGVPLIGCPCAVCQSADPRDRRLRSSLMVRLGGRVLIVDTGPDFRGQCLRHRVPRVDAVFITHAHADHIFGFDDLRRFNTLQGNAVIPCYAGPATLAALHRVFPYISQKRNAQGLYRPLIDFIPATVPFEALGACLTPLPVVHGDIETLGLRIDFAGRALAYLPDVHVIPEVTLAQMRGLDLLILNMLRPRPHPTHLALGRALAYAARIAARRTLLTHLSHDYTHVQLLPHLPPTVTPAHDGLALTLA